MACTSKMYGRRRLKPKEAALLWKKEGTDPPGFAEENFGIKGRGVITTEQRYQGDFLLEYRGERITAEEAEIREKTKPSVYRYFYTFHDQMMCIDATKEDSSKGRLVNHGEKNERNAVMKVVEGHLFLFCSKDINPGSEILYDYGVPDLPWKVSADHNVKIITRENAIHYQKTSGDEPGSHEDVIVTNREKATYNDETLGDVPGSHEDVNIITREKAIHNHETSEDEPGSHEDAQVINREKALHNDETSRDVSGSLEDVNIMTREKATRNEEISSDVHGSHADVTITNREKPTYNDETLGDVPGSHKDVNTITSEKAIHYHATSGDEPGSREDVNVINKEKAAHNDETSRSVSGSQEDVNNTNWENTTDNDETSGGVPGSYEDAIVTNSKNAIYNDETSWNLPGSHEDGSIITRDNAICNDEITRDVFGSQEDVNIITREKAIHNHETSGDGPASHEDVIITNREKATYNDETVGDIPGSHEDVSVITREKAICNDETSRDVYCSHEEAMDVSPVSDKEQSGDECILLYNRRKKVQGHKTIISSDSEKSDSVEIQSEQRPETASVLQSAQRPETASVQVATSNNTKTKRIWDKRNVCVYCKGSFSKLPRHMEQKHKQELEVSLALSYPKGSPRRKIQWRKLQNKGNFSHNREVLLNKTGLLIPYKRPSARSTAEAPDYLPCPDCFGLFKRKDLWRHAKKCTLRKEKKNMKASTKRPQAAAAALIPLCNDVDKNYKKHIIDNLQSDKIALLIRNDPVILEFGGRLYMKCASKPHQHSYVRQKVRELGRFVTEMRETNTAVSSLADCLQPKLFKDVIQAVKKTSKFDENTLEYEIPSLALKLGHSLKKCADIAKSKALIEGDNRKKQEMSDFLELMNTDWNTAISAQALTTLSTRKLNSPQRLPLAEDIKRLNEFLEKKSIELETNLSEGKFDCWRQYAEIILAHIVLFNRRRGGETERMELKQYNDGIQTASSGDMREEVFRSLSDFERSLANTMHRIEIVGKKGRHVAVLLTKQQKKRIDTLNRLRRQAGVDEENKYVFARFGDSLSPVRSSDVLRKYAQMCGASKPELITSTLLRKHVATISQILSLKNNEMDALATFLGHDIRVHREYYRLPDSTYQLAKISKILLGLEKGTIQTMKGRSLDEIQMNSDEHVELEDEQEVSEAEEAKEAEEETEEADGAKDVPRCQNNPENGGLLPSQTQTRKAANRRKWSEVEKRAMQKQFGKFFRLGSLPGKLDCEKAQQQEPCLSKRHWKQLKNFVKNQRVASIAKKQ